MAFTLSSLALKPGDDVFYDPKFRLVIETHLPILRVLASSHQRPISPDKIHQYEGDFYGLLSELGVRLDHHWIYLRVNGMESAHQFGVELNDPYQKDYQFTLLIPPDDAIAELRTLFLTTQR